MDQARVSLRRWLRRQLRVARAVREHLEAAVENDDPAEARRSSPGAEFSDAQRRYVEDVLAGLGAAEGRRLLRSVTRTVRPQARPDSNSSSGSTSSSQPMKCCSGSSSVEP